MAQFVYIDETGSTGKGCSKQPLLTLAAVLVDEDKVRPLATAVKQIAWRHLKWVPPDFELHGQEIWHGGKWWNGKKPPELLAAYRDAIAILGTLDLDVAHSSIDKAGLHFRYDGKADDNAYLLALQFLLEKIDALGASNRILVADEAKQQQLRAIKMVADMQDWGAGVVPGKKLTTVIDSLHFVESNASPGVQMADIVAFILQRGSRNKEGHPKAQSALEEMYQAVWNRTRTWRGPWP